MVYTTITNLMAAATPTNSEHKVTAPNTQDQSHFKCKKCGKKGHKSEQCIKTNCAICGDSTHNIKKCSK